MKGGGCYRLWWLAVAETVSAMMVFTSSSPVFPISLCFFLLFSSFSFFFSLGSFLFIPILLLSSFSLFLFIFFLFLLLSLSSSVFFFFCYSSLFFFVLFDPLICPLVSCALPCIYKKNRGERDRGGHCAASPRTTRGTHLLPLLQHVESFEQVGVVSVPF